MDISALVSSVTGAAQLTRLLVDERDRQKTATIQIDLTDKIAQAQIQLTQVLGAIIEKDGLIQSLTERVRELETQQSEKARYQRRKVGSVGDFYAYALRPPAELVERSDEPEHFLCQPCLDIRKHKSILRIQGLMCSCSGCNTRVQVEFAPPAATRRRSEPDPFARNW